MIKPHTMSLISALLAGCAAVFLTLAHHEPKAALAAGYALLAGVTSLALYLSSRQTARTLSTKAFGTKKADIQTPPTLEVRKTQSLAQLDKRTAQRQVDKDVSRPSSQEASRYEPRYTNHSRA